jgi:uncharacterized integral membrane protein
MKNIFEKINMTPKQVFDVLLIALLFLFVVQNLESVKVRFLFFGFELPIIILITFTFLIGFFTSKTFPKKKKDDNNTEETIKQK